MTVSSFQAGCDVSADHVLVKCYLCGKKMKTIQEYPLRYTYKFIDSCAWFCPDKTCMAGMNWITEYMHSNDISLGTDYVHKDTLKEAWLDYYSMYGCLSKAINT